MTSLKSQINTERSGTEAILKSRKGDPLPLQRVEAKGVLKGLVLLMTLKQVYRNTSDQNIECVYTFPLAWGTTLTAMHVTLNGKRLSGQVIAKKDAEKKYEKAILDGDTPVMLERSGKDLYTANLGNLLPDDEAVIEIEYAQLLKIEQGHLRLTLPTTLAPRYGYAQSQGNLLAHQTPETVPSIEYPFLLKLELLKPTSLGQISSPSHPIQQKKTDAGVVVTLQRRSFLDRDFVLNIHGLRGASSLIACSDPFDPGVYTVLGSFEAQLPEALLETERPFKLKVLVDCSGSMQGDSMSLAKDALNWLFSGLQEEDHVSYSVFGSDCESPVRRLTPCTPKQIDILRRCVAETDADKGGTEMERALRRVIALPDSERRPCEDGDILMITDGEVWDIDGIVTSVRSSGHRLFALGVGSSPAESLLRELAEVSGGACEMVSVNENMGDAIMRLVNRIRNSHPIEVGIKDEKLSPTTVSRVQPVCDGETVHVWTRMAINPEVAPTLICGTDLAPIEMAWDDSGVISRLWAQGEMYEITLKKQAAELALKYQLVSPYTNYFLVHERADDDKANDLPKLQKIAHMQAAGQSGYGSTRVTRHDEFMASSFMTGVYGSGGEHPKSIAGTYSNSTAIPSVWRNNRTSAAARRDVLSTQPFFYNFAQLVQYKEEASNPISKLLERINKRSLLHTNFEEVLEAEIKHFDFSYLNQFFANIPAKLSDQQAWAILLWWLSEEKNFEPLLERHAQRLINACVAFVDEAERAEINSYFEAEGSKKTESVYPTEDEDVEIPSFLRKLAD